MLDMQKSAGPRGRSPMNRSLKSPKGLSITSTTITDGAGDSVRGLKADGDYFIEISVLAAEPVENVSVGYNIKLANGVTVYGTSSAIQGKFLNFAAGETQISRFTFRANLSLGTYYLSAGAAEVLTPEDEVHNYVMLDFVHDALPFVVVSDRLSGLCDLQSNLVSFVKF
jgi:hypothetical protein